MREETMLFHFISLVHNKSCHRRHPHSTNYKYWTQNNKNKQLRYKYFVYQYQESTEIFNNFALHKMHVAMSIREKQTKMFASELDLY